MTCCTDIEDLGCIYSCDLVQIGINASATGIYTLVLMPDLIQVVSTTITISTPIYFSGGYLNEDGRSIFKVKKPDGTYLETAAGKDCFQVDIRPTVNATLADLDITPVACENATAILKNSALTTISTTIIASGATANITAPDATAVLKNSAGTVIDTEAIPSNVSEDITIPNVAWTDSDGSAESTPYGDSIVCTPQVKDLTAVIYFTGSGDTITVNGAAGTIASQATSGASTFTFDGASFAAWDKVWGGNITIVRSTPGANETLTLTGTYT